MRTRKELWDRFYYNDDDALNVPATLPNIWHITWCKGDMNNDGTVNGFDIDPFVMALEDPAEYEDEFPGLGEYDSGSDL
ncbi:MAG: hypothetical protein KKB50_13870 [Planctomycetes bacterium]|nr:hypothetical protein [Planctomycetota bacterium]